MSASDSAVQAGQGTKVGVKDLAHFVHRRGDIHYRYENSALAQEGIARQQSYQRDRPASYRSEVAVAAEFAGLVVTGRIDGWDAEATVVEEIKTTRADANELHARTGDVNSAQLRLYGGMLALADAALQSLRLRLVYLHPDTPAETVIEDQASRDALVAYFEATCSMYACFLAETNARLARRGAELRAAPFPYPSFRPDQRRMAKALFRGFRDRAHWLVEAPTGSGKTIASAFPALKAMSAGHLDRVVFVTSRTTGQRAAERAFRDASGAGAVAMVTITAKERICFNPGVPCDPDLCEYARGYYDRMPAARRRLLRHGAADRDAVESAARAHRVCPFELSLDAAAWADVVIGDYSYVFDPVIRLKRLDNERFRRVALIVDEAHQLGERARDMLGMTLRREAIKAALAEPGAPPALAKGLRSVDRALSRLTSGGDTTDAAAERVIAWPKALERAIDRFLSAVSATPIDAAAMPALGAAHYEALRFRRACEWAEEGAFHCVVAGVGRRVRATVLCTLPGRHIQACIAPFHGSARLSGTLTPAATFQRIHGFDDESESLSMPGLAFAEQLGVVAVPNLSTYYRDRERTLPALGRLIDGVADASPGNVLVALPSFAYARAALLACGHAEVRCQEPEMSLAEREAFIEWVNAPGVNRVAFVVMGGVFAESVDFDSAALSGIVVVGVGLPPPSLGRDLMARDSVAGALAEDGAEIAYRLPAMTRVVQAVGRIARGDAQGIAVLVDPRFGQEAYRAFMPSWWQPRFVPADQVSRAVRTFWSG